MYIPFGKKYGTMYERGKFATMSVNGSIPVSMPIENNTKVQI